MSDIYLLVSTFATFVAGVSCFGILAVLARQSDGDLARAFLPLYIALSVLVIGGLMIMFGQATQHADRLIPLALYVESIVGTYAVLLFLPYFMHRLFAIQSRTRDRVISTVVLVAFTAQHMTEYVLGGVWDDRGDVAEDLLMAGIIAYTLGVGFMRFNAPEVDRPLAFRFLILLGISVPGIVHDVLFADNTGLRFYPLLYCLMSVTITATLVRRRTSPFAEVAIGVDRYGSPAIRVALLENWGLSSREAEVIDLVQRGFSNKRIARQLDISPNTVKTHMRAIFDKSGVRTRFGLLALLAGTRSEAPPDHPRQPA